MTALNQQQLFLSGFRTGPGFIGWLSPDGVFKQLAFATDQEAIDLIGNHSGNANVWVSMATFGPGARREAHSALHLKSFWLDVDAHGKGPYGTPDEALAGINSFVADAGLPQPNYIHMTGHGTQVFWVLARSIARADWQLVADDLQALAKRMDLGADPITADAARILRVPGTYNFRDPDNPIATTLSEVKAGYTDLQAFRAAIKAALSKLPPQPPKPTKAMPAGSPGYTRILDDGGVAKVFEQTLFWRATVDDRMADNIYFDAREAMEAVNAWETGGGKLTFHPVDRRWLGDDRKGYYRSSQLGEVKVIQSLCGSWKIDRVPERCFREAKTAQRYADERLP